MTADWHTREEARTAVFEYLQTWYNSARRHSTLGYLSPAGYEEQLDGSVVSLTYASTKSGQSQAQGDCDRR
jgi:transposase InsO family protein